MFSPRRLPSLDVLRGGAFLAVFLYHGLTILGDDSLTWLGRIGTGTAHDPTMYAAYPVAFAWVGVPMFFVLSGFVIHWAFLETETWNVWRFYGRRFFRLYPAYLLALIGAVAISGQTYGLVSHLLLLHNLRFDTIFSINPALWSLAVEAQFYLLYPLFLWLRARFRVGGAFAIVAALGIAVRVGAGIWTATGHDPRLLISLSTIALWGDWAIGAWAAEQFFCGGKPLIKVRWAAVFLTGAVVATFVPLGFIASFSLFSLGFTGIIEGIVRSANPGNRVLRDLGTISYGAYLWHHPIVIWFAHRLSRESWFVGLPFALRYAVLIGTAAVPTLILAYLSYRFVETPLLQWRRRNLTDAPRNTGHD